MAWTFRLSPDADLELRCFLADLGPTGHAAAMEHLRRLREGATSVQFERLEPSSLRDLAVARVGLTDAAFGNQALAVLLGFAVRKRVIGLLGCGVWPDLDNWLDLPVNGIAENPTWHEYLAGQVRGNLRFRAGSVRIVRSVRQRYAWFRAKFGD